MVKLDKNYNIVEEKGRYDDGFLDIAEDISRAEANEKITKKEAAFLFNLAVKKELRTEIESLLSFAKGYREVRSLFTNLQSK